MVGVWWGVGVRAGPPSRSAPTRVLPRFGCAGPVCLYHPSPRRSRRRPLSLVFPPLLIISAIRIPTAMPRRSAAVDVSVGAIRTLPSCLLYTSPSPRD